MRSRPTSRLLLFVAVACGLVATNAGADTVKLTSGRTIEVDAARVQGAIVMLVMRDGSDVRIPGTLVESIVTAPTRWNRSAALDALAASSTAAAPRPTMSTLRTIVDRVARRVGLDVRLAHAVVQFESNYDPLAVSPRGAMGLMCSRPARTHDAGGTY